MRRRHEEGAGERERRAAPEPGAALAGYSNHALARVLARTPNPELEKRMLHKARPPLEAPGHVDAIFDHSPFFHDLVGATLKRRPLAKVMRLDDEPAFRTAWMEYAQRSINGATHQHYTAEEAEHFLATRGLQGFQDEDRGVIHIRKEMADLRAQVHEGMHLFSSTQWKDALSQNFNANEGFTQFFTRKLSKELDLLEDLGSYYPQANAVEKLAAAVGEDVVTAAYFGGDIDRLAHAADAALGKRHAWREWLSLMDAGDFKGARELVSQSGDHAPAATVARKPAPSLESGAEVEMIFDASPYFSKLVHAKLKKHPLEKGLKFDDERHFEAAWIEYTRRYNAPGLGRPYTVAEAKEALNRDDIDGFEDSERGTMHIRVARADLRVELHEALHLFTHARWRDATNGCAPLNEGVTQYFTFKLAAEIAVEVDPLAYARQVGVATRLTEVIGEPLVAGAYFDGAVPALQRAVDARKGKGFWDAWLDVVAGGDYDTALQYMRL